MKTRLLGAAISAISCLVARSSSAATSAAAAPVLAPGPAVLQPRLGQEEHGVGGRGIGQALLPHHDAWRKFRVHDRQLPDDALMVDSAAVMDREGAPARDVVDDRAVPARADDRHFLGDGERARCFARPFL